MWNKTKKETNIKHYSAYSFFFFFLFGDSNVSECLVWNYICMNIWEWESKTQRRKYSFYVEIQAEFFGIKYYFFFKFTTLVTIGGWKISVNEKSDSIGVIKNFRRFGEGVWKFGEKMSFLIENESFYD